MFYSLKDRSIKSTRVLQLYKEAWKDYQAALKNLQNDDQDQSGTAFTKAFDCKFEGKNENRNVLSLNLLDDGACNILEERYISLTRPLYDEQTIKRKKANLRSILKGDMLCPFIIGLYYLEKDFAGINDYIKKTIDTIDNEKAIQALIYIAMCDFFGRRDIPSYLLGKIFISRTDMAFRFEDLVTESTIELLVSRRENNTTFWRPKHYLIGLELMKYLMNSKKYDENAWKEKLTQYCLSFIDESKQVCYMSNVPEYVSELLSHMFINRQEVEPNEEEDGRFSKLIDTIPTKSQRLEVLRHLAETYNTEAHFWGHLARYYSSGDKNFIEADRCSTIAIRLTEDSGKYNSVIYHIKGDCLRKEAYEIVINLMGSEEPISSDSIIEVRELVDNASTGNDTSSCRHQSR